MIQLQNEAGGALSEILIAFFALLGNARIAITEAHGVERKIKGRFRQN